jgi:phosphoribosylformylglycinamidine cyclo-ligase
MRAERPFAYVIERLPDPLPIFDFIQQHGLVDDREMYGNFNMGVGFAIYVAERDVRQVLKVARVVERIDNTNSYRAFRAGHIELVHAKQVLIEPKGLQYFAESLAVR